MFIYKSSMAGPYHIENGLPCQDSYAVYKDENYAIMAVTDGLGSEQYSDIGASVAANTAVEFCSDNIHPEMKSDEIKKTMNNALVNAYKAVLARAEDDGNDSDEYDSTLCLTVYDGEHLYYAQSGDSGLVALLENGEYLRVTTQQRDEEGRVFPLCWGPEKWAFGTVEKPVSAFMLMTDGVFEQICPKIMEHREIDINIPLARRFLDRFDCTEEEVPELEEAVCRYLDHFPRRLLDDDKTVVILINSDRIPKEKDDDYYAIPDWEAMRSEAEKKLSEIDKNLDKSVDNEMKSTDENDNLNCAQTEETDSGTESDKSSADSSDSERQSEGICHRKDKLNDACTESEDEAKKN